VTKLRPGGVIIDVKCMMNEAALNERGVEVWRL
jgi:hypothetical protein